MKNASGGREAAKGLFEREYHSDENQILDSLTRIERKAEYAAKRFGTNIDYIYDALDFDPISYQLDSRNDSWLKETEQYAMEAMQKIAVPAQHGNYGGKNILADFIADDNAIFGFFEKSKSNPAGAGGEVVERKEIVLKEEIEYVDKLIGWVDKHKKLTAAAIIGSLGFGAAVKYKADKHFADDVDSGLSKAKAEISAGASGIFVGFGDYLKGNQPPVIESITANSTDIRAGDAVEFSAKAFDPDGKIARYEWRIEKDGKTETAVTPAPTLDKVFDNPGNYIVKLKIDDAGGKSAVKSAAVEVGEKVKLPADYDYYDSDFKVGIVIEGDPMFKQNVTNLIETFKQVTPDDYADLIKYAPVKIVRSPDNYA
ncbi:MAG: PKD domain-containing protein, partial [Nanoarchaeota archaeon]|nr:PKD domain-containing protein [Nanoarchaeota archaeon]